MPVAPRSTAPSGPPDGAVVARAGRGWLAVAATGLIVSLVAGVSLPRADNGVADDGVAADRPPVSPVVASSLVGSVVGSVTPGPGTVAAPVTTTDPTVPVTAADRTEPVTAADPVPPTPTVSAVPVGIRLGDAPDIPVVPIGVSPAGVLDPPDDVGTAGWWVSGPRPGGPGRTVIAGHIDSRAQGLGAFVALTGLAEGDHLTVTTAGGMTLTYRVAEIATVVKTRLDPAVLLGTDASDLLLVTCIGDFDPDTRSYASNLLVTAVPEPTGSAGG